MGRERKRVGVRAVSETSIQIDFEYKGMRCRERIKLKPTPANLKRVEIHRGAILDAIARGTFDYAVTFPDSPRRFLFSSPSAGYALENYLETWLQRQKQHLKASTYRGYKKIVDHLLIPGLGGVFLSDLRRSHVRSWCDGQNSGNKTLANVQSVLRKAMQDALDDDLIEINPLYGWTYARKEAPKQVDDVDPFTAEDQLAILKACGNDQCRNLFQFAFWSGLRTSELVALEWGDVDFMRGYVRVRRAKTQAGDEPEETKTKKGTRDVKLLPAARAALEAQKIYSFLKGDVVFLNPRTGEPWEGDQAIRKRAWVPALKLAGVRYRRPYQTRHTYASMMLTAGENPVWVAAQMGHSDVRMIFRVYARWIPEATPDAGNKAVMLFDLAHRNAAEKLPKVG